MSQTLIIFSLFILLFSVSSIEAKEKTIVHSISKEQMLLLRKVDKKYQESHGIHLTIKKEIVLGMLGTSKSSEGEIWIDSGKMRLEIHKPEVSKIVADKKYLWIESGAPADFKDAKVQVMRASLKSDQAKSQGLIQLLTGGGVLKYFRVSGIRKNKDQITYFLQPDKQSIEFKRAQLIVDSEKMEITQLKYWDQIDNETTYMFVKSEFDQKLDKKIFAYVPPKNSELIVY